MIKKQIIDLCINRIILTVLISYQSCLNVYFSIKVIEVDLVRERSVCVIVVHVKTTELVVGTRQDTHVNVPEDLQVLNARLMSMNVCLTLAFTVFARMVLEDTNATACQVEIIIRILSSTFEHQFNQLAHQNANFIKFKLI